MNAVRRALAALPTIPRAVLLGAVLAGVSGAIAGLVIGLRVYAATAWFAMVEVGLPAAVAGAVLGLLAGSLLVAGRHVLPWRRP